MNGVKVKMKWRELLFQRLTTVTGSEGSWTVYLYAIIVFLTDQQSLVCEIVK